MKGEDRAKKLARLIERMGKELGAGITKRTVLDPQTKEDSKEIERLLGKGLRERLDRIEAEALEELSASPRFREAVEKKLAHLERRPDFSDPAWPQDWPGAASILCAAIDKLGFKPYADGEWYAAKIAQAARMLKASLYVEGGSYASPTEKSESVAEHAMRLAALRTEWRMKRDFERKALRHEAGGAARKRSIEEDKTRAIEMARISWAHDPSTRIGEMAAIIREEDQPHRKEAVIRRWLKEAERDGILEIPAEAKRPGRRAGR